MAKLWGTRFHRQTGKLADKFTSSISYDQRLAKYDCIGSIAHVKMLARQNIIPKKDAGKIIKGLNAILKEINAGKFKYDPASEDIHSNIQHVLKQRIGKPADKLHTARSRNDQIALDTKLYIKAAIGSIKDLLESLQRSILGFAKKNIDVVIPAYTHLQQAQVILLAHQMLAYLEMFQRDKERLLDCEKRADSMPLGACALSGTTLPIDRFFVAKQLGFSKVTQNSIDSVSDRDFILELLADLAILSVHLSRISEDLILWSTSEFGFVDIDWAFCTGSSIMPHKKNPDVLELVRGSVGKILGDFSSVLVMMKGLPLSYNRDMQLDKPPLFNAVDTIAEILKIYSQLFKNIKVKKETISKRLGNESLFSVDLAEYLIKKGLSYRQAHDTVGKLVRMVSDKGKRIKGLGLEELKKFSDRFDSGCFNVFNSKTSVNAKKSFGGTAPLNVKRQIISWGLKLNA